MLLDKVNVPWECSIEPCLHIEPKLRNRYIFLSNWLQLYLYNNILKKIE